MNALADSLLRRLGIDPRKFRLLVDLFHKLSERKELLNQQLGLSSSLLSGAILNGILGALVAVVMLVGETGPAAYLATFEFLTGFILGALLLAETAHTLVNPEEGLVLVHQPIDGATYTSAKLVHLGRVVLYIVTGLNAVPAYLGLFVAESWTYPFRHMAIVFAIGFAVAFACCALFGWLMRFVPPARMKTAAQVASGLAYLIVMPQFRAMDLFQRLWKRLPALGPWADAVAIALLVVAVVLGLRALSADYLIRVTRLVQGGSRKRRGRARDRGIFAVPGRTAARWLGGPAARAGFAYVARMMARDWQFRRQIIGFLPTLVVAIAATRSFGSPFEPKFTAMHLFPHTLGLFAFFTCSILKAGSHHKAVWLFQLAPSGAFSPFSRGVYAALWTILVFAPNVIALPALAWLWGAADALLFVAFAIAVGSLYLGVSLGLVDGLPFGHQPEASQAAWLLGALMGGGVAAAIAVAVQHHLLFHSRSIVGLAAILLAALAAALALRASRGLAIAIRHYLNTLGDEKAYREVPV